MEKSSETLAGQAFLDVAVKATEDAEDSAEKNLSSVIPSVFEEDVASPEERIPFLLKECKMT